MTAGRAALGMLLGLTWGIGLWLIAAGLPLRRTPPLIERVAPYLRDLMPDPLTPPRTWLPGSQALLTWQDRLAQKRLSALVDRSGSGVSVDGLRDQHVMAGLAGAAVGTSVGVWLMATYRLAALGAFAVLLGATAAGVWVRYRVLCRQVQRRERQIVAEFPVVADLMALSVAAGEGIGPALSRIGRGCVGALPSEFARISAEVAAGLPFVLAVERAHRRIAVLPVQRFLAAIIVALERGTPLAGLLRAQANEVREETRRSLIEAGARKEILMMIPVIFLVLPVTVVFAVYPGIVALELGR